MPFALAYLADTEGGSSGAPVFLRDGTDVIAINHSGWTRRGVPYHNAGSLMSYIVPEIQQYLPSEADPEYADLVVEAPLLTNNYLLPGESFTLSATVRNQGDALSTATTLRFYQSTNTIGTILDFEIGTADVGPLNPNETAEIDITLNAPTLSGTHRYHACVDTSDNENNSDNNCSPSVLLTVPDTLPEPGPEPGPADVDGDRQVTVVDLVIVALFYGTQVPAGTSIPADVNDDGTVNIIDLVAVAEALDATGNGGTEDVAAVLEAVAAQINAIAAIPEAPARFRTSQHARLSGIAAHNLAAAFADVKPLATDDARLGKWMPLLKELLHRLTEMAEIPETTALLPNYPNPFNPETWIPYRLATDAAVILTIYDTRGVAVRVLMLGHQPAGVYQSKHRAAYWDGRNARGESVASGLYFYTLTAGEFTATRKLLIVK